MIPYGVCLTIPLQADLGLAVDQFEKAVHRLRTYFVRDYPSLGFVWRVELQRNKMPHLHLIVFAPFGFNVLDIFLRLWRLIVCSLFVVPSLSFFLQRGVRVDKLDGNIRAYRYLCDHSGKRKQYQLGYVGRQWGVVGRSNFVCMPCYEFDLPECLRHPFYRFVRRLTSFSVKCPCVFGNKHIRRKRNNVVSYVCRDTVLRWLSVMSRQKSFCSQLFNLTTSF